MLLSTANFKTPFSSVDGIFAILGCTVCENFDGRVFISGHPELPNTVFYSARDESGENNPLYFGELNYFCDGTGPFGVCSILAAAESLAIFKSGDDGGGSIYYHTPKETGDDYFFGFDYEIDDIIKEFERLLEEPSDE